MNKTTTTLEEKVAIKYQYNNKNTPIIYVLPASDCTISIGTWEATSTGFPLSYPDIKHSKPFFPYIIYRKRPLYKDAPRGVGGCYCDSATCNGMPIRVICIAKDFNMAQRCFVLFHELVHWMIHIVSLNPNKYHKIWDKIDTKIRKYLLKHFNIKLLFLREENSNANK